MSMETWGLVPKAQDDSQTIEEAILAAIADHEADPTAHQGEGESLQAHKSDTTIDHPAESVVADKYAPFSIPLTHIDYTKRMQAPQMETLTNWSHGSNGEDLGYLTMGGYVFDVAAISGNYAYLYPNSYEEAFDFATKNPMQDISLRFNNNTNQTFYAFIGPIAGSLGGFGFKIVNATIYACWRMSGTEYTQALATLTVGELHRYRCQYIAEVGIEFYIDNQLLFTATTNLPTGNAMRSIFHFRLTTNANQAKSLIMMSPIFICDI